MSLSDVLSQDAMIENQLQEKVNQNKLINEMSIERRKSGLLSYIDHVF